MQDFFFFKNVFGTYFCWALRDHWLEYISVCPQRTHHLVWGWCVGFKGHVLLWLPRHLLGFSFGSPVDLFMSEHHMTILSCKIWGTNENTRDHTAARALQVSKPASPDCNWDSWSLIALRDSDRGVKMPVNHYQAHVQVKLEVKICMVINESNSLKYIKFPRLEMDCSLPAHLLNLAWQLCLTSFITCDKILQEWTCFWSNDHTLALFFFCICGGDWAIS